MDVLQWVEACRRAHREWLTEPEGKAVLRQFGVAVPAGHLVRGVTEWRAIADGWRYPTVVKMISSQVIHKSDVAGVRLGLETGDQVEEAMADLQRISDVQGFPLEGFLLEEMVPQGLEMLVGGRHDERFGPVLTVGTGGIFVEVFGDATIRICPVTVPDAQEMVHELRGAPLLKGARGRPPLAEDALVDAIVKIGGDHGLLMSLKDIVAELDVNPLIVGPHGAVAADVRCRLQRAQTS